MAVVLVAVGQIGIDIDLPEQPLADSLRAIAAQTNTNVLFDRSLVGGRRARALKAHVTPRQALDEILRDTGLTYRTLNEKTISIVALPAARGPPADSKRADENTAGSPPRLEEVVVTAERRTEGAQDVAGSIAAFTSQMLDESKIWNAQDLQQRVPGLLISNNGAYGQPYLRGVGSDIINPGADSPIAVFIDGAYQARQTSALTDLFDIDRVEVLKGPQGTLYGRNASGGAINLVTQNPQSSFSETSDVYFGSNDTWHLRAAVNVPVSDEASFRVAGLFSRRDGYTVNLTDGSRINDEHIAGLRGKFRYATGDVFSVVLGVEYLREDDSRNSANKLIDSPALPLPVRDLAGRFGLPPLDLPTNPFEVRYDFRPDIYLSQLRVNATTRWRWNGLDLTSITAYTQLTDVSLNDLDATPVDFAYDREADHSKAFTQTLQLSSEHWVSGLEYFEERGGQNFDARLPPFGPPAPIALGAGSAVPGFVWDSSLRTVAVAGFAEGTLPLAQNWSLNAGLRYSWERKSADFLETLIDPTGELTGVAGTTLRPARPERSFSAWTPKLRVDYRPLPDVLLYTSATRGFKSGGFNLMNTGEVFLPETLWSFEAGLKSSWLANRLRANASGFYYDYRDLQVNQFSGVTNLVTNAASSRIRGLELEVVGLPASWLQADTSVALLDARYSSYLTRNANAPAESVDLSGNRMPHAPRATLAAGLEATLPVRRAGRWMLRAETRYQALIYFDQFDTPQLAQGGYWLINAHLQFAPPSRTWSVELVGTNLTDKVYRQSVVRVDSVFGTEVSFGAPRTYGVIFATHF